MIPYQIVNSEYLKTKNLRKKGYKYKLKNHPYQLSLTKNNIVIIFNSLSYQISFDYGKTFENIMDSDIGTQVERDLIRSQIIEYEGSHPVDKQRGDVVNPMDYIIKFLDKYLE